MGWTTTIKDRSGKEVPVARWLDENGKQRQQKCRTLREAKRVAAEKEAAKLTARAARAAPGEEIYFSFLDPDSHYDQEPSSLLAGKSALEDLTSTYLTAMERGHDGKDPIRPNTLKGYKKHANMICANFKNAELYFPQDAGRQYRDLLLEGARQGVISRTTAKARYDQLKRMCGFAVVEGLMMKDPTANLTISKNNAAEKQRVATVKRESVYQPDEIKALVAAADAMCADKTLDARAQVSWNFYYRPLLHTLIGTGMRISEARALRREDVDAVNNRVHVHQGADHHNDFAAPKSANGVRSIPVQPAVIEHLKKAMSHHKFDLVFASANGTPRADNTLRDHFLKKLCKRAGTAQRGFHGFRQYYASRHIAANTPTLALSKWLGHHSPAFTMSTYAHFFDDAAEVALPEMF